MLRAVIISPDVELADKLGDLVTRCGRVALVRGIDRYLTGFDLERFLRASAPQIVFLGIQQLDRAIQLVEELEHVTPNLQVVAVDRGCNPVVLLDLMRAGVREFISYPFDSTSFSSAMSRLEEVLEKKPAQIDTTDLVISFLPSKAGAGTSTIALNASLALSRAPETNVLLMDLDLNSGLIAFMLRLESVYSIYDAAASAERLDEDLWPQLVANTGRLDVLPTGRLDPQTRIEPAQIRKLIAFARRFYRGICIDLSGNMEKFSLEVMQESKRIFLVCTPEIPSLHLARQKYQLLNGMDLGDRVSVLLNRAQKRPIIATPQIEQLLGVPVFMEFPNEYAGVHKALTNGKEVEANSELGRRFADLSYAILDQTPPRPSAKKKFLEFFSVPRYSLSPQK